MLLVLPVEVMNGINDRKLDVSTVQTEPFVVYARFPTVVLLELYVTEYIVLPMTYGDPYIVFVPLVAIEAEVHAVALDE